MPLAGARGVPWLRQDARNAVVVDLNISAPPSPPRSPQPPPPAVQRAEGEALLRALRRPPLSRRRWHRPPGAFELAAGRVERLGGLSAEEAEGFARARREWPQIVRALCRAAFRLGHASSRLSALERLFATCAHAAEQVESAGTSEATQEYAAELLRETKAAQRGVAVWGAELPRRQALLRAALQRRRRAVGDLQALLQRLRKRQSSRELLKGVLVKSPRAGGRSPCGGVAGRELRRGDQVVFLPSADRLRELLDAAAERLRPPLPRDPAAVAGAEAVVVGVAPAEQATPQEAVMLRLPSGATCWAPRSCLLLRRSAPPEPPASPPPEPSPTVRRMIGERVAVHNSMRNTPPVPEPPIWPRRVLPDPRGHLYAQSGPAVEALCDAENKFFYDAVASGGLAIRSVSRVRQLAAQFLAPDGLLYRGGIRELTRASYAQQVSMELRLPGPPPEPKRQPRPVPPCGTPVPSPSYPTRQPRRPSLTRPPFHRHTEASARKHHSLKWKNPSHAVTRAMSADRALGPMYPLRPGEPFTTPAEQLRL